MTAVVALGGNALMRPGERGTAAEQRANLREACAALRPLLDETELVDPRDSAVGSIAHTIEDYPNVGTLLPAMGYGREQMDDLKATIEATDADLVLIGTPIDLRKLIDFDVPALRVTYRLQEVGEPTLADVLAEHGLIGNKALV